MNLRRSVPLLTCVWAATVALAACGSSSSSSSTPATSSTPTTTTTTTTTAVNPPAAGSTLALQAEPSGMLAYIPTSLKAKPGTVTIAFTNQSPVQHDVVVASGSGPLGMTPIFGGATKSLTLTLAKGTYTFYCSVPGHRQSGMQGTLTVN